MRYGGSQQSPEKFIIFHASHKKRPFPRSFFVVKSCNARFVVVKHLYSFPSVRSTMSLRAQRVNLPKGTPHYKTHARYFCTCVEKKAHTSKRVSIIAPPPIMRFQKCSVRRTEGTPYKNDDAMFLPVGKSDAPMARCVPLSRCELKLSLRAEKQVPREHTVSRGVPVSHELSGSWKNSKRRKLSVFNRVDGFLSGNPKYRYKACEKCRGDAAQKDNSDLANTVT